ncbi:MAG: PEP-CTERM sorting domain-containing protein [Phycisphaeraceae bacterium]|nr:PEP-CTERM sorting domain-containing protein [Phycisphaeraceae bacterium]
MTKFTHIFAIATIVLMPAAAMAGIDFGATENGSNRPSWGRAAGASWGMSGFLMESGNKFTAPNGAISITVNSKATYDPIAGFGATNSDFLGYQVSGPGGTRLIYDRLAAQIVTHVLGGDTDDQIPDAPKMYDRYSFYRPQIAGNVFDSGGQNGTGFDIPQIPTPTPTPEPTSAALMGLAAWMVGLRRPTRTRQA